MTIDDLSGIDRLNRLLDRADARPPTPKPDAADAGADWDPTLRRLRRLDQSFSPPPGALARIRADLGLPGSGGTGTGEGSLASGGHRARGLPRRLFRSVRRGTIVAEAKTAAIVLLSLLSGYLWFRVLEGERRPEPAVVAPGPEACLVAPAEFDISGVSRAFFPAPTPADGAPAPPPNPNFAAGRPADRATAEAIAGTVRELAACANAGSYGRFLALTTAGYQERYFDRTAASFDRGIDRMVAAAEVSSGDVDPRPRADWIAVRAVDDLTVLADGRIGALLDVERPLSAAPEERQREVVVFVWSGDRWLLDQGLEPPVPNLSATPTP